MFYKMPVTIYEEEDCIYNHRAEISQLGTRALIVTGHTSSKKNGSLSDVCRALDDCAIPHTVFDEIEENPSVETVMKARNIGIENQSDFVIGLGGGSPIDAAKAIAIMIANPDKSADYLYEKTEKTKALPIAAVPTTCGTGSEVTAVSVLTVHEKRTKASLPHRVFPKLALLDAKYLTDAPMSLVRATAVDALAHFIESYINTAVSDYIRMFVRDGLLTWATAKDVLCGARTMSGGDAKNLLHAAMLAGMSIAHGGTTVPHGLSYMLTYELSMPHGIAVGRFLPGYMRLASEEDRKFILTHAGFADMHEFDTFISDICGNDTVPQTVLERSVRSVAENTAKLASCPFYLDKELLGGMVQGT